MYPRFDLPMLTDGPATALAAAALAMLVVDLALQVAFQGAAAFGSRGLQVAYAVTVVFAFTCACTFTLPITFTTTFTFAFTFPFAFTFAVVHKLSRVIWLQHARDPASGALLVPATECCNRTGYCASTKIWAPWDLFSSLRPHPRRRPFLPPKGNLGHCQDFEESYEILQR